MTMEIVQFLVGLNLYEYKCIYMYLRHKLTHGDDRKSKNGILRRRGTDKLQSPAQL